MKPAIEAINSKYGGGAAHPIERITCQYRLTNRASLQEYVWVGERKGEKETERRRPREGDGERESVCVLSEREHM